MIIVVANVKNASGKTTIAANLAVIRAQNNSDVLLVDADAQLSVSDFASVRTEKNCQPEITCVSIQGETIWEQVRKLKIKFNDIIIDLGIKDSITMEGAISLADVLVIPFLPSQIDSSDITLLDNIVGEMLSLNDELRVVSLINKSEGDKNISKDLQNLTLNHIKFSEIEVGNRIAFRRSIADGVAVTELKGKKDLKSIKEMKTLYKEVFQNA